MLDATQDSKRVENNAFFQKELLKKLLKKTLCLFSDCQAVWFCNIYMLNVCEHVNM